jgi:hypothetical protein
VRSAFVIAPKGSCQSSCQNTPRFLPKCSAKALAKMQ